MSRLTEKDRIECGFWIPGCNGYYSYFTHGDNFYNVVAKLAHYEDLEEQGQLMEQKYGQWEEADDGDGIVCSVCGTDFCTLVFETDKFQYCPNCGAKMLKGTEE